MPMLRADRRSVLCLLCLRCLLCRLCLRCLRCLKCLLCLLCLRCLRCPHRDYSYFDRDFRYTVTVTTQSGTTHSSSLSAELVTPQCIHANLSVCVMPKWYDGYDGSAKLYPTALCKIPLSFAGGANLSTNEGYSVNVTLEIGSQYNVTEQVSTFVPATSLDIVNASAPGSELPAPVYVTQEKLADDMRAWYDIPSTTKVSSEARPQAYGILQNPTIGGGSYRPEDLSTAYMLNGISQDLLGQVRHLRHHFLDHFFPTQFQAR